MYSSLLQLSCLNETSVVFMCIYSTCIIPNREETYVQCVCVCVCVYITFHTSKRSHMPCVIVACVMMLCDVYESIDRVSCNVTLEK